MTDLLADARPYVRWWWLGGPFQADDIPRQLTWIRSKGFGGVEISWIYPTWLRSDCETPDWLGAEWRRLVHLAKRVAGELQLGCDFTFGSAWPFGGRAVDDGDASQTFDGFSPDRLWGAWDDRGRQSLPVLNHLSTRALRNYAHNLGSALQPALELGPPSALFCDSWELDSRRIWSEELWDVFAARFQYDLRPYAASGMMPPSVRYDYLKFLDIVIRERFYREFTAIARRMGGFSRVQVHGSPTDPIAAYAEADIPETEALLYEPKFSRLAASAAAMSGKAIVSCEAFTCLYGFPDRHLEQEDIRDLKLLADALLAEGVNHFVWHGMPYQPSGQTQRFYATCHVGPDGALAAHTRSLNHYLTSACDVMRHGQPCSQLAVYLPREDEIMHGEFGQSDWRVPGENHRWEMRRARLPDELAGYNPLWISEAFLQAARGVDGRVCVGPMDFDALCVDVEWLDYDALVELVRLSSEGATIVLSSSPRQPGRNQNSDYAGLLGQLRTRALGSVQHLELQPLVDGPRIPPFFARRDEVNTYLFFAHPAARLIEYPMYYGQAAETATSTRLPITIRLHGHQMELELPFDDLESIVVTVHNHCEATVLKQGLPCGS